MVFKVILPITESYWPITSNLEFLAGHLSDRHWRILDANFKNLVKLFLDQIISKKQSSLTFKIMVKKLWILLIPQQKQLSKNCSLARKLFSITVGIGSMARFP